MKMPHKYWIRGSAKKAQRFATLFSLNISKQVVRIFFISFSSYGMKRILPCVLLATVGKSMRVSIMWQFSVMKEVGRSIVLINFHTWAFMRSVVQY